MLAVSSLLDVASCLESFRQGQCQAVDVRDLCLRWRCCEVECSSSFGERCLLVDDFVFQKCLKVFVFVDDGLPVAIKQSVCLCLVTAADAVEAPTCAADVWLELK